MVLQFYASGARAMAQPQRRSVILGSACCSCASGEPWPAPPSAQTRSDDSTTTA